MRHTLALIVFLAVSCTGEATRRDGRRPGEVVQSIDTNIRAIFQDSKSRYWFGSDGRGIYCCDATTIRHFSTADGLANDRIRSIQEDRHGNILVGTLGGVSLFDGERFTKIPLITADTGIRHWRRAPTDLWFPATQEEGGVYRYDGKHLFHLIPPKSPLEDSYNARNPKVPFSLYGVYTIYHDRRGNLWLGGSTFGACRFDGTHFAWLHETDLSEIPGGGSLGIRGIIEDADGTFFISNNRHRFRMQQADSAHDGYRYIRYTKAPGPGAKAEKDFTYFQGIARDTSGRIWMTTYGDGIWKLENGNMQHLPLMTGSSSAMIVTIARDRSGQVLLGTANAGVFRFDGQRFQKFPKPD